MPDEADHSPTPVRWSELPEADATAIWAEIAAHPAWAQELFSVRRRADGALLIELGTQNGPYSGGGQRVLAQRVGASWSVEYVEDWVL